MAWNRNYYVATVAVVVGEVLLWLYSFRYISAHSNPLGDGMEWLAALPLTVVLVVPAAISALLGWWLAWAAKLAAGLAALAAVIDVVLWIEIVGELGGKPAH